MSIPRPAALAAPPLVLLLYLAAAFAIGKEHSCKGGLEIYAALGLLTLPVLAAAPCLAWSHRHWLQRALLATASLAIGILVWAWAFEASGMYFMCRLF